MNYMDVFSYNDLRNLWHTGITLPRITQMHKLGFVKVSGISSLFRHRLQELRKYENLCYLEICGKEMKPKQSFEELNLK